VLSSRSEYRPEKGGVENQPVTTVLKKDHFERRGQSFICTSTRLASLPERKWTEEFLSDIREEGKKDKAYEQARKQEVAAEEVPPKDRKVKEVSCENNLLYRQNLL